MSGDLLLLLRRFDFQATRTRGELIANGLHFAYVCEDTDRRLESGGIKVPKQTAIPRGRYKVILSYSNRFGRIMPEILNVPQFAGIRFHGGNDEHDTEGCPLLGEELTPTGVRNCAAINAALTKMIGECYTNKSECWVEVV